MNPSRDTQHAMPEGAPPSVHLGKLTRREFREAMQAGRYKLCILPIAAVEQHLEHLAMEHDWRSVSSIAESVASRCRPRVLVAQALMVGISEHHFLHPGTLSLRPGTFLAVLNDLIRSLCHAGFENILVLNGHGGNVVPCEAVWDQFLREFQINLRFMSYWDVLTEVDGQELLRGGHRLPDDLPGHAQEFETSIAQALFPENIRADAMATQSDTSPQRADEPQGRAFVERIVERVTKEVDAMLSGDWRAEVPPFHP